MRQLYRHSHEGVRFSKNGHRAYLRGEKPRFLWPPGTPLAPTGAHHIEIGSPPHCKRPLTMFYKEVTAWQPI